MSPDESEALRSRLFAHAMQPQFLYSHVWDPSDLLLWANISTIHSRDPFAATETRIGWELDVNENEPSVRLQRAAVAAAG
jgi:alpha-ketoglutarate-dependent taurine dioxygenase